MTKPEISVKILVFVLVLVVSFASYGQNVPERVAGIPVNYDEPQTGDTDGWSDPKGEFLAAVAAAPVDQLLGKTALQTDVMPAAGTPILNDLGYYMHAGGHGILPGDYDIYLEFMKKHFVDK